MLLLVAATELEMIPARARLAGVSGCDYLEAGVGPVETTLVLCRYLLGPGGDKIRALLNFGVAGAFAGGGAGLLDLCLAQSEVFGDFGVCYGEETVPFASPLAENFFPLDPELLARGRLLLAGSGRAVAAGNFVTVNAVSGTARRGTFLQERYRALCENMEGAAVARVGKAFRLPVLELRCVSNLVEERQRENWRLEEASLRCGEAVAHLAPLLLN